MRQLGHHDVKVSALALGGHHYGDLDDESVAIKIIQGAVDWGDHVFR